MTVQFKEISFHGWPGCLQLSNDLIELVVTTAVGPRIIRFGFADGSNEFAEFAEQLGKTGGDEWLIYGGHRFWHAPEHPTRTYYPDNRPVTWTTLPGGLHIVQDVEMETGIQKELEITLAAERAEVRVLHRLRNRGSWAIELAPWALSVMAPGGTAIAPLPPRGSHGGNLLPNQTMALWAYTDMSDPRWTWGSEFLLLRQDMHHPTPQKIGLSGSAGWIAYWREGNLFVKRYDHVAGGHYPDFGSAVELFTNDLFLELETLAPLTTLPPGGVVEHVERWQLFSEISPVHTETDVRNNVLGVINESA